MKLAYAFSQLSSWADTGRAADPAVDASIRAAEIDEMGRKAFLSGREPLSKLIGDLTPESLEDPALDKFVVRSLAIVVAVWAKGLTGPGMARGTAHHRALVAQMEAFARILGAHPEMPPAVRARMHELAPPPPKPDPLEELLEQAEVDLPEEELEAPKTAEPIEFKEPTALQRRLSWAARSVHPGWWGALVFALIIAIATCTAD